MKLCAIALVCVLWTLSSLNFADAAKGNKHEVGKKGASKFLGYKECMKMMKCGPEIRKECAEECKAGNTREEIEEHTERLKKIGKYVKDAKDAKRMSKREDTDFSDSSTSDDDDDDECDETGKHGSPGVCRLTEKMKHAKIPNKKAAVFLSYKECMRRMNCGKQLKKECAEECKEGNTEEEIEEHGSFLRNINKYIAEAKRREKLNDLETTTDDSDDTDDDDDDDSTFDDDSTSDDDTSDTDDN